MAAAPENATLSVVSPRVATTDVGAVGTDAATKLFDGADGALSPAPFVDTTVHVYVLPLVNDDTVTGLVPLPARVVPPSLDAQVAVSPVIGSPPSPLFVNDTVARPLPRIATPIVGASGTVAGVTVADGDEASLSPCALVASRKGTLGQPVSL